VGNRTTSRSGIQVPHTTSSLSRISSDLLNSNVYCLIKRSYVMVQLELLLVTLEWAVVERGYVAQSQSMMAVTEG
jgi:hypothetical protein